MGSFKKFGAGLFATALLAGVLTTAPTVAFADDEAPATQVAAKAGTPVGAAVTSKCEVTFSLPKTAKVVSGTTVATISTNGVPCLDTVFLDLRRIGGGNGKEGIKVWAGENGYQNGVVEIELNGYAVPFVGAGKYKLVAVKSSLNYDWALKNNLSPYTDHPKITFKNNVIDVRRGSSTSLAATRKAEGAALKGKVTSFVEYRGYQAQPNATVKLQKLSGKKWVTKKTVKTNRDGKFAVTLKDTSKAKWRAATSGTSQIWPSHRDASIAKKAKGKAKTKISRKFYYGAFGRNAVMQGSVKFNAGGGYYAAPKGVKIAVQKKDSGKWKTVKTVSTNSSGKYSYETYKTGSYRFVVKGTSKYASKASAAVKY